jgi:hypothetical protein
MACGVHRSAADIVISEQARTRLLRRDYRPRKVNRGLAAGLVAAAAAAAIAIPLAVGAGSPPGAAGPTIRLASHTFRMPAGYRLTAATSAPCHPFAVTVQAAGVNGAGAHLYNTPNSQAMQAAASSAGGCIVLALAPPYTPTATAPDPEAYSTAHPVQVGSYHGFIYHVSMFVLPGGTGILSQPGWHTATDLYVQLPAGRGEMRDLVIGATGLSDSTLIEIAASGLSS